MFEERADGDAALPRTEELLPQDRPGVRRAATPSGVGRVPDGARDHDDLQAMARHFVEDQCRDLTPERRAASAQFVLLLLTTGLELLRGVAVHLCLQSLK